MLLLRLGSRCLIVFGSWIALPDRFVQMLFSQCHAAGCVTHSLLCASFDKSRTCACVSTLFMNADFSCRRCICDIHDRGELSRACRRSAAQRRHAALPVWLRRKRHRDRSAGYAWHQSRRAATRSGAYGQLGRGSAPPQAHMHSQRATTGVLCCCTEWDRRVANIEPLVTKYSSGKNIQCLRASAQARSIDMPRQS